ncbi:hypothetical protein [Kitasatospora sp. NPDC090091]|uniref:hypothetical protein n=1 Tax=Kitasatospora sp. NPDC090091 TaxID=3364081 RepID=UPI003804EDD0
MPLDVRAAGAVLLLFGQHVARIAALPVTALAHTDGHPVLVLAETRVRLPEPAATLLAALAAAAPPALPGHPPRSASVGCHARPAPGRPPHPRPALSPTALVQLAEDLPPAVLATLLGLHAVTAEQWRRRASTDWTAYLEARGAGRVSGGAATGP